MSLQNSPLKIKLPKRQKLDLNLEKCIICQNHKTDNLSLAKEESIKTFIAALEIRKDDVFERIQTHFSPDFYEMLKQEIKWHSSCYGAYTSKTNLKHVKLQSSFQEKDLEQVQNEGCNYKKVLRSEGNTVDWSMCIICQRTKYKGSKALSQVLTETAQSTLQKAAEVLKEQEMQFRINDTDLIAYEAQYHSGCYQKYISKSKNMSQIPTKEGFDEYDKAFDKLLQEYHADLIDRGKAIEMTTILNRFKEILSEKVEEAENYRSEKLKRHLINHYGNGITFQKQEGRNKSELVYSTEISLKDSVNALSIMKANSNYESILKSFVSNSGMEDNESQALLLYRASQIIRGELKLVKGINISPPTSDDISLEKAVEIVPDKLYMLLRWILEGDKGNNPISLARENTDNEELNREILSVAQDIIYISSHGQKDTPKHVDLAVSLRHLTGSKSAIQLLNHHGHLCRYDKVCRIDTSIALDQISRVEDDGVIIPSNIRFDTFIQAAADNTDLSEETLDGKKQHMAQALYYISVNPKMRARLLT